MSYYINNTMSIGPFALESKFEQMFAQGDCDRLGTVGRIQLGEYRGEILRNAVYAYPEDLGDVLIGQSARHVGKNLRLTWRERLDRGIVLQ